MGSARDGYCVSSGKASRQFGHDALPLAVAHPGPACDLVDRTAASDADLGIDVERANLDAGTLNGNHADPKSSIGRHHKVHDAEGNRENRHNGADQWLFVVSGTGVAHVNERRVALRAGSLLLIEHGDRHEIRNNGRGKLVTLNFYVPPAYSSQGDELRAGKPAEKAKPRQA